jgi:hypothetical protein
MDSVKTLLGARSVGDITRSPPATIEVSAPRWHWCSGCANGVEASDSAG